MKKITPWSYRKGSSPIHRLSAGIKLTFLLSLSLLSFFPGTEFHTLTLLGIIALILILLSFASGIGPAALLRGSGPLFFIILGVFLFQGVELSPPKIKLDGLRETIIFCARIGTAFCAGTLLFSVTTTGEIRKSLSRAEAFLHLENLKLSLYISLMLGFLPRFFEIWEDLSLAWKSRGGKRNLLSLVILIPLLVEKMMMRAAETATAMESRSPYNGEF